MRTFLFDWRGPQSSELCLSLCSVLSYTCQAYQLLSCFCFTQISCWKLPFSHLDSLEQFVSYLTALLAWAFNTGQWELLLSFENPLEEEMVGIWFWNSVYLTTNKIWPTSSFAYRNICLSEEYPNHQIMQFGKTISFPPVEQHFHFESEREDDCTDLLKNFCALKDTPVCINVTVWTLQQAPYGTCRYSHAFCIPTL